MSYIYAKKEMPDSFSKNVEKFSRARGTKPLATETRPMRFDLKEK